MIVNLFPFRSNTPLVLFFHGLYHFLNRILVQPGDQFAVAVFLQIAHGQVMPVLFQPGTEIDNSPVRF